jgi:UPF0755 protein
VSDLWDPFADDDEAEEVEDSVAPPPTGVPSRRALREAEEAVQEEKRHTRSKGLSAVVTVLIVGALGAIGYFVGVPIYHAMTEEKAPLVAEITDYPGPGVGSVEVVVNSGDTGNIIAKTLKDADVVATEKAFLTACSENTGCGAIQPGIYTLKKQMKADDAVTALLDPTNRETVTLTVPEGYRADQVFQLIADKLEVPLSEVEAAASDTVAIGLPPEAEGLVEGWLFPDTYNLSPDSTPASILATMVGQTTRVLDEVGVPGEQRHDVIVLASMVEKETRREEDRSKAARVFLNRIEQGMKLQSDATVVYGVGRFDDNVWTTDEERADDNPYNTYVIDGLPVGAICNPGRAAIEAAFRPADGPWIYMVVVNDDTGEVEFNETAEGHAASLLKYQEWLAAKAAGTLPTETASSETAGAEGADGADGADAGTEEAGTDGAGGDEAGTDEAGTGEAGQ